MFFWKGNSFAFVYSVKNAIGISVTEIFKNSVIKRKIVIKYKKTTHYMVLFNIENANRFEFETG